MEANVAIATVWLQHQVEQLKYSYASNPWQTSFDNFRINTPSLRPIIIGKGEDSVELLLKYDSQDSFSVYRREKRTDKDFNVVAEGVSIKFNPEDETQIIFE